MNSAQHKFNMKIGLIGFGKMGSRIAEKLLTEGHEVVGWNRSNETIENFKFKISNLKLNDSQFIVADDIEQLIKQLKAPRIVWLMLPSGVPTQTVLDEVAKYTQKDDIVIDGGNAFYQDTQKRNEEFSARGIRFLGIGVSGGIIAEKEGYPLMVGGDKSAYEYIKPVLDSLAKPGGGHEYFGYGGAGHFVKMVHNGVEYGMMQAIGEGFGVLQKAKYNFDLLKVAKLWQKGTIVDSFLIDRAKDALEKDANLADIVGEIAATGEAEWTINEAKKEDVPVGVIESSLEFRKKSLVENKVKESFAAKMVAALRREFGGHEVKKKD